MGAELRCPRGRTVAFSVVQGVQLAAAVSDHSAGTVIARIRVALDAPPEVNAKMSQGVKDGASVVTAGSRVVACKLTRKTEDTAWMNVCRYGCDSGGRMSGRWTAETLKTSSSPTLQQRSCSEVRTVS